MKLPYVESQSSKEVENVTLGKYNVTDKVSSMTVVNGLRCVCVFFFLSKKVAVLGLLWDLKSSKVAQSRLKSPKIALSRLKSPLVSLSH